MPNPLRLLALAVALPLALSVAACDGANQPPLSEAPLAGAAIPGGFTLTDENGQTRRWTDFAGQWRIIYFGYTFCPDVCPTDVSRFSRGLKLYARDHPALAAKIQPMFVTVDPARDTPDKLREFTDAFDPRLIGFTGTPEQIAEAAKNFAVLYSKGETTPGGGYLMDHTTITYLFGPDGKPVATLPIDQGPEAVAAELARWVR